MKQAQTKMLRRSGNRKITAITKLKSGEFQIAIPTHGWFNSSDEYHLRNILKRHGYAYYFRAEREEE